MTKDPEPLRILFADEHEVVRQGLRVLLESRPGWLVCGEASDGQVIADLAGELQPDIAIVDVAVPTLDGTPATRQIRKVSPRTEVLIFAERKSEQLICEALAAGAKGYLLKSDAGRLVMQPWSPWPCAILFSIRR
jgi:DNA-binding NarL/FixJ family response regulator